MITDDWWKGLSYSEKQKVMRRHMTRAEYNKLHSDKAAVTWWSLLHPYTRVAIRRVEAPETDA
jgi:hypothetical protein